MADYDEPEQGELLYRNITTQGNYKKSEENHRPIGESVTEEGDDYRLFDRAIVSQNGRH